jgi:phosphoglycerate dehydrogenase-like enzyme
MTRSKILLTGPLDDYAHRLLEEFGELDFVPDTSESTLLAGIDGAVALAVRGVPPISAAVIDRGTDLKVIGRTGVGYSNVDIAAATARGLPVVYAPGAGARAVAEASLTYMLALTKKVLHWDREMKAGNWKSRFDQQGGDLEGATVGIIGLGRIGQMVAEMVRPFQMRTVAVDPFVPADAAAAVGAELVDLDSLLAQSDFICLHCAQTQENTGLINRDRLARVKRGAFLINLARGGIVESLDVLHEALESGRLGGVALDVFEPEPPDVSHPIFRSDLCLTAPHAMAGTDKAMARIFQTTADGIAAVLRGERPQFVVNPEVFG